jgi:hypothetical protein
LRGRERCCRYNHKHPVASATFYCADQHFITCSFYRRMLLRSANQRDQFPRTHNADGIGSHPFAKNAKGWGTLFLGRDREIKRLGHPSITESALSRDT